MTPAEISERISTVVNDAVTLVTDIGTLMSELADMLVNNDYEVPDLDDDNG